MQVIHSITLQNFRCFEINKFEVKNLTYICGENGSGKTSILEAIALIGGQGSFRSKTLESLIRSGEKNDLCGFEVSAETCHGRVFIGHNSERKTTELDGEKITTNQLKKLFCPVVFSPNHELSLATQSSTRTFIDRLASVLFPHHEKLLNKAKELSSERLKILFMNESKIWLGSIEEQISQCLVTIAYNRLMFIQKMQQFFTEVSPSHTIDIFSMPTDLLKHRETFSTVEKQLIKTLEGARVLDRVSNKTTVGKAEYCITFEGKDIEYCSSGQQKLIGAMLTLATGYFAKQTRSGIVILLDDITAKIDNKNQSYLENVIKFTDCQTIISTIYQPRNSCYNVCL